MNTFTQTANFGQYGRSGELRTRRGLVTTPTFMPDGTRGAVKSLTPQQVVDTGVQIVLANTYHLHLAPGEEVIKELGGLHAFANRQGPMLTDSGGFQVFSLGDHTKITEEGVEFRDPKTGDKHFITPEKSIQIQLDLGADMIVAFDHLIGLDDVTDDQVRDAFDRTHRWLERCIAEFNRLTDGMIGPEDPEYGIVYDEDKWTSGLDARSDLSASKGASRTEKYGEVSSRSRKSGIAPERSSGASSKADGQTRRPRRPLLFGVVQGGLDIELRKESLRIIQESSVDGVAIGGLSVGETREEMAAVLEALAPHYDPDRPRFLLGVGTPEDLKIAVENGIDMLDCVLPTRNARHSSVWGVDSERMNLSGKKYQLDTAVIEEGCDCYTCSQGFSRAFLRHQFKVGEPLAGTLASIHNLRHMSRLCERYHAND